MSGMLETEHGFRVVDIYARLAPNGEDEERRGPSGTPERLEREMHQAGITRTVVFPPTRPDGDYLASNNGVARRSVGRPFTAFARIEGSRSEWNTASRLQNAVSRQAEPDHTTASDVERYAYDDRFDGFVLDPAVDGYPTDAVLETLEEVGLPVIVRGGLEAPPPELARHLLGRSFPVIVAHFGGHAFDRSLMGQMIDLLAEYDNCYIETSFVRHRDILERAVLEHPDRVLFGSGAPACHPDVAVMEILTLDVSEDLIRRIFSKNACRVIEALAAQTNAY